MKSSRLLNSNKLDCVLEACTECQRGESKRECGGTLAHRRCVATMLQVHDWRLIAHERRITASAVADASDYALNSDSVITTTM